VISQVSPVLWSSVDRSVPRRCDRGCRRRSQRGCGPVSPMRERPFRAAKPH
jgi:hypothetical protein